MHEQKAFVIILSKQAFTLANIIQNLRVGEMGLIGL